MTSLAEDFPKEQARVRGLLVVAKKLPPQSGFFYVAVCEQALKQADMAAASGDVVAMITAYKTMKEIKS